MLAAAVQLPDVIAGPNDLSALLAEGAKKSIAFLTLCVERGHKVMLASPGIIGSPGHERVYAVGKEAAAVLIKTQEHVSLGGLRAATGGSAIQELLARIEAEEKTRPSQKHPDGAAE